MRILAAVLLASLTTVVIAQEPGSLWQTNTTMEMGGMKMPGRNGQMCVPLTAEGPEAMAQEDNECTMTNVRRSPGRFSYDVTCPQGSGTGEMVYQGRDSYTMTMTMTADGETMKMVTQAKRGGTCDASKVKKQIAAIEAQGRQQVAQGCASMVESLMPSQLTSMGCEAQYKKQLCDRFGTRAGFDTVAQRQPTGNPQFDGDNLAGVAGYCGMPAEGLRTRLCREAVGKDDLDFIGRHCPADAQPIAQRECAGRSYSTPPAEKYRDFCSNYAREMMQGGGAAESAEPQPPKPGDAVKEGAKKLKGLFGL